MCAIMVISSHNEFGHHHISKSLPGIFSWKHNTTIPTIKASAACGLKELNPLKPQHAVVLTRWLSSKVHKHGKFPFLMFQFDISTKNENKTRKNWEDFCRTLLYMCNQQTWNWWGPSKKALVLPFASCVFFSPQPSTFSFSFFVLIYSASTSLALG